MPSLLERLGAERPVPESRLRTALETALGNGQLAVIPLGLAGVLRNRARSMLLLVAFSIAAGLVMTGVIFSASTHGALDATYAQHRGADATLWINGASCDGARRQLASLPPWLEGDIRCDVSGATRLVVGETPLRVNIEIRDQPQHLWTLIPRDGEVDSIPEGAMILEASLARELGLERGDRARLKLGTHEVDLDVSALASDPSKGPYPIFRPGMVYVRPEVASALGAKVRASRLLVKTPLPVGASAKQGLIDDAKAAGFAVSEAITTAEFRQLVGAISNVIDRFVGGVAMLATIAAALLVAMLMQASVIEESREIAVLKAVGSTPAQIAAQMLTRSLILATAGVLVGLAIGLAAFGAIAGWASNLVDGVAIETFRPAWLLRTAVVVIVAAAVFSVYPALAAARVRAAAVLRGSARLRGSRLSVPSSVIARPTASIGVGFLTRRPARAIMAIFALATSVAVVLGTTGTANFSRQIRADFSGDYFDLWVGAPGVSSQSVNDLLSSLPEIEAHAPRFGVPQVRDESGQTYWFEAFPVSQDLHRATTMEGRQIGGVGEIVMGPAALARLGARVGDTVTLEIGGIRSRLQIVGVVKGLRGLGDVGEIAVETLVSLGVPVRPYSFMVRLAPGADADAVAQEITDRSNGLIEARRADIDTAAITGPLSIAMGGSSLVVIGTGLLALLLIMLLTLREFRKELMVMKALGASASTLMSGAAIYGSLVALAAGLISIPLSQFLANQVFGSIIRSFGISGTEIISYAPRTLVITAVVVIAAALGGAMSGRIARERPGVALRED